MNRAECKALNIPWPLGECISGSGDFVPHPGEERFDFPCSATWRDYYEEAPEARHVAAESYHDAKAEAARRKRILQTMKRYDVPMPEVIGPTKPEDKVKTVET